MTARARPGKSLVYDSTTERELSPVYSRLEINVEFPVDSALNGRLRREESRRKHASDANRRWTEIDDGQDQSAGTAVSWRRGYLFLSLGWPNIRVAEENVGDVGTRRTSSEDRSKG